MRYKVATLTWALILLEAHPEIFSRLHKAVTEVFGYESKVTAPVTFEIFGHAFISNGLSLELFWLYPTGPLNVRTASIGTILSVGGGPDGKAPISVKAGSTVAYNTYLMHRRENFWDPDLWKFRPERWDGKKAGWGYIPFHGGPQTCPGRKSRFSEYLTLWPVVLTMRVPEQHALMEMVYVLTHMLQR